MNLGVLAAGAAEEILQGRAPADSPNLAILANLLDGEPVYDPIIFFYHGHVEMKDTALGYCRDIAWADGIVLHH